MQMPGQIKKQNILTRPSILCVTHQVVKREIIQYGVVLGGTGSVLGGSGWYLVVQGQFGVVLVGTWWYWVSITQYCLVLSCIGSAKGLYACIYWKKWRFGRVLPMPHRHTDNRI